MSLGVKIDSPHPPCWHTHLSESHQERTITVGRLEPASLAIVAKESRNR